MTVTFNSDDFYSYFGTVCFNNKSEKHGYIYEKQVKKSMIRNYCPKKVLQQGGNLLAKQRCFILNLSCTSEIEPTDL